MMEIHTGRDAALKSLERNLAKMNHNLTQKTNLKKFFWTPDLNTCGFATQQEIQKTMISWAKHNNSLL